jgi:hypothetical protein
MANKTKNRAIKKDIKAFVGRVSDYGSKTSGRKHIEVPKDKRKLFQSGDHVKVDPLE